jgi:hypothetical protein
VVGSSDQATWVIWVSFLGSLVCVMSVPFIYYMTIITMISNPRERYLHTMITTPQIPTQIFIQQKIVCLLWACASNASACAWIGKGLVVANNHLPNLRHFCVA